MEEHSYDAALIHVGINDLLRNKDNNDIENIAKNIIDFGLTCQRFKINKIFISAITFSKKINSNMLTQVNEAIRVLCSQHGFTFIPNTFIQMKHLWKDGVHLKEEGLCLLARNSIDVLNDFLKRDVFPVDTGWKLPTHVMR